MPKEVSRIQLGSPASGLRASRCIDAAAVVHGEAHSCSMLTVSEGKFALSETLSFPSNWQGPWSRIRWPLIAEATYFRSPQFDCSFGYNSNHFAAVSPGSKLSYYSLWPLRMMTEFGLAGQYGAVFCLPISGHVLGGGSIPVPKVPRWPATVFDVHQGGKIIVQSKLFSMNNAVVGSGQIIAGVRDLQGCTEIIFMNADEQYSIYDKKIVTYTMPHGVASSPNGQFLALLELGEQLIVEIIDLDGPTQLSQTTYAPGAERPDLALNLDLLAFSPCSTSLFVPGNDGCIKELGLSDGVCRSEWVAHSKHIVGLSLCADNRHLISCGLDGDVALWNISSRAEVTPRQFGVPLWLGQSVPVTRFDESWKTIEFD